MALAQSRLREGRPVKILAQEPDYAAPSARSRVFAARTGMWPRDWLNKTLRVDTGGRCLANGFER